MNRLLVFYGLIGHLLKFLPVV